MQCAAAVRLPAPHRLCAANLLLFGFVWCCLLPRQCLGVVSPATYGSVPARRAIRPPAMSEQSLAACISSIVLVSQGRLPKRGATRTGERCCPGGELNGLEDKVFDGQANNGCRAFRACD